MSAPFHPPLLGHRVLVEGTASAAPRICGGVVLEPVHVSPMPEIDGTCNTILPAEDRYTVPFAPRPPGPSAGRIAFDAAPGAAPAAAPPPRTGVQEFTLDYDFDTLISGRHSAVLAQILDYATASGARRIEVAGARGATLLSDASVLTERAEIAEKRAREVASLLGRAGTLASFDVSWSTDVAPPDGDEDWRSRRVIVRVFPAR
ncbi:MAG TPA: hypothetical protein VE907_02725 [Gammaproteobacteria bacterium]|nr:hypothetical protein [Gammaproteobacteria bacterium]